MTQHTSEERIPEAASAPAAPVASAGTSNGDGTARPVDGYSVAPVALAGSGLVHDLRAIKVIWQRELIRFSADKARIISSLFQPLLFLFVMGTGLSRVVVHTGNTDYRTFLFPGVVVTSVLFVAVFSGISIVWDREFGFLREMLVAPIRRSAIVVGKCLGGATTGTAQGIVLLVLAGVVGVPYNPLLMLSMLGMMFLTAFSVTALGLVLAARVKTIQGVMPLAQMSLAPLMFLSGALYPIGSLPTWLQVLTRINPLTYAVEAMRTAVFAHLSVDARTRAVLDPGVTWDGWRVPVALDVALVVGLGALLLWLASVLFRSAE